MKMLFWKLCTHFSIILSIIMHQLKLQNYKRYQPDWLTADILDKMKESDKLKKHGGFKNKYKDLRNHVSSLIDESTKAMYEAKIEEGKDDLKSIWKTFKTFSASNKKVGNYDSLDLR